MRKVTRARFTFILPSLVLLLPLAAAGPGCSKTEGRVEALKGWTLPKDKSVRRIKIKHSWMKPVAQVVACRKEASELLLKKLGEVSPAEACGFMVALGYLKEAKAVDPILAILKAEEGPSGEYAAFALVKLKSQGSLEKIAALEGELGGLPVPVRLNVYRALAWAREAKHYPVLVKGVDDPDPAVGPEVLKMMATLKDPVVVEAALRVLEEGPEERTALAVKALVTNRESLSERNLVELAKSDKPFVREGVIQVLGILETAGAVRAITAGLDDPSPRVASAAAEALANLEERKKLPGETLCKIASLIDTDEEDVAKRAYEALVKIGCRSARKALLPLLDSKRVHTLRYATFLLIQCAPSGVHPKFDLREYAEIPKLIALLGSSDTETVQNATSTLYAYTRQPFEENAPRWEKWWKAHAELMNYIGEAQKLVAAVKKWRKEETIIDHKEEAIQNLEKASELYEKVEELRLTSISFDKEQVEINMLLRQVRTAGGFD
jgi:HEAT repeat protein